MSDYPTPDYVVIEVNGQIDVIEHRGHSEQNREPTRAFFWWCDDPEIIKEGVASKPDAAELNR